MKWNFQVQVRYHIDFQNKWMSYANAVTGLGFFLMMVYYFGLQNMADYSVGKIIFSVILPMLVFVTFGVLTRGMQFAVTPVYGVLGAVYCVLMAIGTFSYNNLIYGLIAMLWYILTAVVCLSTAFGYLTVSTYMLFAFLLPAGVRLIVDIFLYVLHLRFITFIPDAAAICGLVSFGLLALCMRGIPIKRIRE